jgi:hypothetical protein
MTLLGRHHFSLGMNPGTPVDTTALNLIRALIPSEISRTASSGMAETSKFSWMRAKVVGIYPCFHDSMGVGFNAHGRFLSGKTAVTVIDVEML